MSQVESLREKLHTVMNAGSTEMVLELSQELDTLIHKYMSNEPEYR